MLPPSRAHNTALHPLCFKRLDPYHHLLYETASHHSDVELTYETDGLEKGVVAIHFDSAQAHLGRVELHGAVSYATMNPALAPCAGASAAHSGGGGLADPPLTLRPLPAGYAFPEDISAKFNKKSSRFTFRHAYSLCMCNSLGWLLMAASPCYHPLLLHSCVHFTIHPLAASFLRLLKLNNSLASCNGTSHHAADSDGAGSNTGARMLPVMPQYSQFSLSFPAMR